MSQPHRILMLSPQFRPMLGGYERAAERLSIGLAARGHRVAVVTERRDSAWPEYESVDGIEIFRVRSFPSPRIHSVSALASLVGFLLRRGHQYDVIHIHQYGWMAAAAIAYSLFSRRASVLKLTNTGADGIDSTMPRGLLGKAARALHRRVNACVTTSERARAEAIAFGIPRERIHRIPNPLDPERFRPASETERRAARAQLGLGEGFVGLSVSRLSGEKNHALLVDAWESIADRHPEAVLAILGSGPLEAEIRDRIARSPASGSIHLMGRVDDPRQWYAAADVFLLPSNNEGLSNSLMEAMGCALPAICTRVSGSEDIFLEAEIGRIVEIGDARAFANALDEAISRPDLRTKWGRAARHYAERHFALEHVVSATLSMYARLSSQSTAGDSG